MDFVPLNLLAIAPALVDLDDGVAANLAMPVGCVVHIANLIPDEENDSEYAPYLDD